MATETPLVEWAIGELGKSPPMQSVLALVIVLLVAFPLIRGALREGKAPPAVPPVLPSPPPPLIQETPWLITTLTGIQIRIDQMLSKQDDIAEGICDVSAKQDEILRKQEIITTTLTALVKLLRRRQSRR
ncbi:hypothetical protein [Bradyrhizobium sp. SYSU BS000235]|uniref:hypothetical protein n=1 Tax=Bradyrhizobium sp. SYSU BS000235 TaxID=3411332 RepID=UPI003C73A341